LYIVEYIGLFYGKESSSMASNVKTENTLHMLLITCFASSVKYFLNIRN